MSEEVIGCVEPAGGPIEAAEAAPAEQGQVEKESKMTVARAGAAAPNFQGNAYYKGGFTQVKLSDYKGKWTVLCFYPGDFTFV